MKKIFLASTLILLLLSCKENKSENPPVVANAVDNAEKSDVSSYITKRGESNMVYEIYYELMKNDKNLQNLDDRIKNTYKETEKVTSQYNAVINKSETYYTDAANLAKSVSDSIMNHEIRKEIKANSEKYNLKIKHIKDLLSKIAENRVKLQDQYVVFQIKKTLPEIEKYQNAHPLKTDSLDNFIKKQNALLSELKSLK